VLVIKHVHLTRAAAESSRDTIERVHGMYAMRCPLYRTLRSSIQLTSSDTLVEPR
jgi:hypothetical protein